MPGDRGHLRAMRLLPFAAALAQRDAGQRTVPDCRAMKPGGKQGPGDPEWPFVWAKSADDIHETVAEYCRQTC